MICLIEYLHAATGKRRLLDHVLKIEDIEDSLMFKKNGGDKILCLSISVREYWALVDPGPDNKEFWDQRQVSSFYLNI